MITGSFYPTDMTFTPDVELTKTMYALKDGDNTTDITEAYYIGYLDPHTETNPKMFTTIQSTSTRLAECSIRSFQERKIPWGWLFNYNFNAGTYADLKGMYFMESDFTTANGNIGSSRLINSLQTPKMTMDGNVSMSIRFINKHALQWVSPADGSGQQTCTTNANYSTGQINFTPNEFLAFLNGGEVTASGGDFNVTFTKKQWNDTYKCFETEDTMLFIAAFFIGRGNTNQLTNGAQYPAEASFNYAMPFIQNKLVSNFYYKYSNYWRADYVSVVTLHDNATDCTPGTYPYFRGFDIIKPNNTGNCINGNLCLANFEFQANGADMNWVYTMHKAGYADLYIPPSGGLWTVGGYYGMAGNNFVRLDCNGGYSIDFIKDLWALSNKIGTASNDYNTFTNLTPEFSPGGRPEGNTQPSQNQIPVLQPWQEGDINDSEFNPNEIPDEDGDDDKPETQPDVPDKRDIPPEEKYPDALGFNWANIAMSKFYVFTATGMEYLRKALASSWDEADTASFWYKLGEVEDQGGGTFKVAAKSQDIKNYIVSCRVYPGDLSRFCESDTQAGIPFGYQGAAISGISRKNLARVYFTNRDNLSVTVNNRKGSDKLKDISYLDFEPYTQARIYLPYCGIFPLPMIDVLCAHVNVYYTYNFTTGEILYTVVALGGCATKETKGFKVIMQRTGIYGIGCSINGNDIVTQGDTVASATLNKWNAQSYTRMADDALLMSPITGLTSAFGKLSGNGQGAGGSIGYAAGAAGVMQTGVAITNAFERLEQAKNGETAANLQMMQASRDVPFNMCYGTSSSAGTFQSPLPYIEIDRPMVVENGMYHNETFGRPWNRATRINEIKGYLKCASPVIKGIANGNTPATELEMNEISQLLRGGVYNGTG